MGRYHSWVVEDDLPDCFDITSVDENGQIMSMKHTHFDIRGVQYHPELKSRPFDPHPLFSGFIKAALMQSRLV